MTKNLKLQNQRKFEQNIQNNFLDIAINELALTTFPDPESQRDVRDWSRSLRMQASARRGMWRSPSEGEVPKRSVKVLLYVVVY
ncbi:hypothetical protein CH381_22265 [Leptospira sp. mixed culture ATI2-C-A1]|nr:hypothetical protein CH381_22265 [Leptospira sp. mixed culture ATI2-C-A1]